MTEGIRDCEITPIKIDLDFRKYKNTDKEIPDKIYDMEDIIKIAQCYPFEPESIFKIFIKILFYSIFYLHKLVNNIQFIVKLVKCL